jgi:hypothetical protein
MAGRRRHDTKGVRGWQTRFGCSSHIITAPKKISSPLGWSNFASHETRCTRKAVGVTMCGSSAPGPYVTLVGWSRMASGCRRREERGPGVHRWRSTAATVGMSFGKATSSVQSAGHQSVALYHLRSAHGGRPAKSRIGRSSKRTYSLGHKFNSLPKLLAPMADMSQRSLKCFLLPGMMRQTLTSPPTWQS